MRLIAGLGNPGAKYAATRHNIGFMVTEAFAARNGIALKRKGHQGVYGVGRAAGSEVMILLPQTYMNRSGISVHSACQSLGLSPGDLIVVHDEIDLPFGALRVKVGGGHGGHNGLRSICADLGSSEFVRIRVGVGRPPADGDVVAHVLSPFSAGEKRQLENVVNNAVLAVEAILLRGVQAAMNEFHGRDIANTN